VEQGLWSLCRNSELPKKAETGFTIKAAKRRKNAAQGASPGSKAGDDRAPQGRNMSCDTDSSGPAPNSPNEFGLQPLQYLGYIECIFRSL
jgi:hypothetical protein